MPMGRDYSLPRSEAGPVTCRCLIERPGISSHLAGLSGEEPGPPHTVCSSLAAGRRERIGSVWPESDAPHRSPIPGTPGAIKVYRA